MKKLPSISKITYSNEFFSKMNSKFSNLVIIFIGIFVTILSVWIIFGKCEDVVSANGTVRPTGNTSSIYSLVSGKVEKIYYTDSQSVEKGDLLLSLVCDAEQIAEKNIQEKITLINEKVEEIDLMIESFNKNRNIISQSQYIPYTRMKIFFDIKKDMTELSEIYQKNYDTHRLLPKNVISDDSLRDSERSYIQSKISLAQFAENFLAQLILEKENYNLQLQNLEISLAEIKRTIENSYIRAPIDGKVFILEKIHENDLIMAHQLLLSIVPENEKGYEIILRLHEKNIKDLEEGLPAKVRFNAYKNNIKPLQATVINISPDSLSNGEELFYIVTLRPDLNSIKDEKDFELKSGLQAHAKIIINEQNILSYIMKKMEIEL